MKTLCLFIALILNNVLTLNTNVYELCLFTDREEFSTYDSDEDPPFDPENEGMLLCYNSNIFLSTQIILMGIVNTTFIYLYLVLKC